MREHDPARLMEEPPPGAERLCLALEGLRAELPQAPQLARVQQRLRAQLRLETDAALSQDDSGVRLLPRSRQSPPLRVATGESCDDGAALQLAEQLVHQAAASARRWRALALLTTAAALAASAALCVSALGERRAGPNAWSQTQTGPRAQPAPIGPDRASQPRKARHRPTPPSADQAPTAPKDSPPKQRVTEPPEPLPHHPGSRPVQPRLRVATASPTPAAPSSPPLFAPAMAREAAVASAERAPVQATGRLNINSIPVSSVLIDGRPLGGTPHIGLAVAPGRHTLVFVHPDHGRRRTTVNVDDRRTVVAAVRFQ